MVCPNCNDEGFRSEEVREKSCLILRLILCRCQIGQELEKLWEEYPAWRGAPYRFFKH